MDIKITPIVTKTRSQEYQVCPHCNQEIMEKSTFCDQNEYIFHRPCMEKGPIDKLEPFSLEKFNELFARKIASVKHDPKQLEMGIEIEKEHSKHLNQNFDSLEDMATAIAKDHLEEIPDYYTRLQKMEEEAKKSQNPEKKLEAKLKILGFLK